jgi:hypothetical protein
MQRRKETENFYPERISLSCNLSLAPGFSPVGAGDAAPSRFNGFVAAGAENG